ncbi:kinesin-like protein CG14535 [Chrysoperla carnea]|uniref:kinesin-like protein CG14535 n=1 Tax=Chrysoperla carnea TaxID=189513 RepID=UPI001D069DB7|nr:kinesin-like protein CG14535 [Chrysoperla carnea]
MMLMTQTMNNTGAASGSTSTGAIIASSNDLVVVNGSTNTSSGSGIITSSGRRHVDRVTATSPGNNYNSKQSPVTIMKSTTNNNQVNDLNNHHSHHHPVSSHHHYPSAQQLKHNRKQLTSSSKQKSSNIESNLKYQQTNGKKHYPSTSAGQQLVTAASAPPGGVLHHLHHSSSSSHSSPHSVLVNNQQCISSVINRNNSVGTSSSPVVTATPGVSIVSVTGNTMVNHGGVFGMFDTNGKYGFSVSSLSGHHHHNTAQASAAAAFFARASQKLNLSSSPHRRKRHSSGDEDTPATGFCGVIQRSPPPVPPALLRRIGVREITGVGKVKVMLRVSSSNTPFNSSSTSNNGPSIETSSNNLTTSTNSNNSTHSNNSFFNIDKRKKQVTLFDPTTCNNSSSTTAPEDRRVGVAAPKMFAFDAIFSQDDSQTEVCSSALTDVIHAVINGTDGCLFCFGHAGLGKSYTMLGSAENANTLGIIPCAITWLFRGINEQKQKTGARFSVRVSAVEVCGPSNQLKDLLAGHANDSEQSPGVYLRDDPVFGTQLQNHSELRVPTAERAAFYLDAAMDSRGATKDHQRDSHLLYTLHVYQYSVAGKGGVAGGRSRLHLIDLGNSDRGKSSGGIPLSGLGNILLAIFNGQKHLPYKEHKLTHLLKECLSSLTCHAAMIAHVSPCAQNYIDTLTTVQLASRIHRMRRRKFKFIPVGANAGSGGSSGEEAARTTGTSSEPDPSSSDLSADTVIYVGPADDATDGEHPPVYIPSLNSGDNRCAMGKALRGSSAEHRTKISQKHDESKSPVHKLSATNTKQSTQTTNKSPAHCINSAKSSPVRTKLTVSKSLQDSQQSNTKIPVYNSSTHNTSDEQWIDGPRISKHKVAEARHLMKETHHVKKRETWIDGPMQVNSTTLPPQNVLSTGYGYMDSHKKSMIRKWVENQTSQIQRSKRSESKLSSGHSFKEMTTFKTCEDDEPIREVNPLVEDSYKKQEVEKSTIRTGLKLSSDKANSDVISECKSNEELPTPPTPDDDQKLEIDGEDDEEVVVEIPPALPLIQPLSSREVSMESLDVRIKERLRSGSDQRSDIQDQSYNDDIDDDNDDEVLEIIEVEEPLEPVPTMDSCLQCTEEDIALCMSTLSSGLDDGKQMTEEHPLRILSQENLTVVSTFTDSMSVFTDLERNFPKNNYVNSTYLFPDTQAYSIYSDDYEDPDCPAPDLLRNVNPDDTSRRKFEQLARLHELYTNRLAKANVTNSFTYKENRQQQQQQRSLSRCDSLTMSEMLYGNAHETGSIYSEPPYRPDQEKFCENCKVNMLRPATAQNWYTDPQLSASATHLANDNLANIGSRFQRFCHKVSRDSYNIASLRHPDGASNPNLKDETERHPGNGASGSDHDDEYQSESKNLHETTKLNGSSEVITEPLPPPASLPSQERMNRRMLSIGSGLAAIKLNQQQNEGYDSGHDSTPRTSKHSPAAISRRAESGYDSVVRDSESSSIDSDISRRSHALPTRGVCGLHGMRFPEMKIRSLCHEQTLLKIELAAAKARLMIPRSQWNYELHVESSMDWRHPGYIEALEAETIILRKRVDACKSHIMMVTCFDAPPKKHIQRN